MQTIKIEIKKRHAKAVGAPVLVCRNKNNSEIVFTFDEEWAEAEEKTARFIYDKAGKTVYQDVPFRGDTVKVPPFSGVRSVRVGVYAGDLTTTTAAYISCDPSILCGGGEEVLKEPNPLEYATNPKYAGASFPEGYELTVDIPNVMSLEYLFYGTTGIKKVTIKGKNDGTPISWERMFTNSSIEVVDMTDFGIVPTNLDNTFYNATMLREIIGVVDVRSLTTANGIFYHCSALEELRFLPNTIVYVFDVRYSPKLSAETIQSTVDGLNSATGGVLYLHSEVKAKITEEQWTEIFNKNWSIE